MQNGAIQANVAASVSAADPARIRLRVLLLMVVTIAVSFLLRAQLHPLLGDRGPYQLFALSVLVVAAYGGFFAGILTTIICAVLGTFAFVEPIGSLHVEDSRQYGVLAIFLAVGSAISVLSQLRLTSERRALEGVAAWREEEARFRATFELAAVGIAHVGLDGRWVRVNQALCDIVGYPLNELLPLTFQEITHPDDLGADLEQAERLLSGEIDTYAMEKRYIRKDGSAVWVNLSASVVRDNWGKTQYFIAVVEDIERRKATEAVLSAAKAATERERAQLETVFQSVDDGIIVTDNKGRFLLVNEAQARICGYESAQEMQRNLEYFASVFELHRPGGQLLSLEAWPISRVLRGETLHNWELNARRTDTGQEWCFSVSGAPIYNDAGELILTVVVTRDVTAQKRLEKSREDLLLREKQLREEAEKSNQLKDEFLAVLSHELRTPMNVIMGWSSVIASSQLDESTLGQAIKVIQRNSRLQMQLIEDLLDVSRIIAGNMRVEMQDTDFKEIVDAALTAMRETAAARSIEIVWRPEHDSALIHGDPSRLQQVVSNLVSNAIKFSREGSRVEIVLQPQDSKYVLSVRDFGQGIEPEFLPLVFERFSQADSSSTRRSGGLGLGLAIARHLVELHGGKIEARSEGPGKGAEFKVSLPLSQPAQNRDSDSEIKASAAANGHSQKLLSGVSVLLVDDDPDALELISLILERAGARVLRADSAHAALELLHQNPPSILISDIGMPEMDGYSLIDQIRNRLNGAYADMPAIALTAYAGSGDRERALKSGFNQHVTKPVEAKRLVAIAADLAANHS